MLKCFCVCVSFATDRKKLSCLVSVSVGERCYIYNNNNHNNKNPQQE